MPKEQWDSKKKRPLAIKFDGFGRFSKKWLGRHQVPYDCYEAANGNYSELYRWLKKIMFPFAAKVNNVAGERISIRITYIY